MPGVIDLTYLGILPYLLYHNGVDDGAEMKKKIGIHRICRLCELHCAPPHLN